MQYWQSYDAFSRVSMSIGTNQLITALSYYVLGYVLMSNHAVVASWLAVVLFMAIACALIRLDMSLTAAEYRIAVSMVLCGPICTAICSREWAAYGTVSVIKILMPLVYVSHAAWLVFILYLSKIREQKNGVQLPTGFRSVLYIDVFGWIKDNPIVRRLRSIAAPGSHQAVARIPVTESAAGPAIQSVRYDANGRPVPMRVEQLSGASRGQRSADITKADFAPQTFVPREKEDIDVQAVDSQEVDKAGTRPWKVFCGATSLLAILWWIVGVLVTVELIGVNFFEVVPLASANEELIIEAPDANLLQSGQAISTQWPHENVHAVGLACNAASNTVLASSRFGLYTANFADVSPNSFLQFRAAPGCQDIEGESLEDVSLQCGSKRNDCQAVVLHQQGRQLAQCDLTKLSNSVPSASIQKPAVALIAEDWLSEGDAAGKMQAETIQSLALSSKCQGANNSCTFVGTSSDRIVELQATGEDVSNTRYVPQKLLQGKLNGTAGSSMDVIHGRYLALLQKGSSSLQVIDLQSGGSVVGTWHIPHASKNKKNGAWSAMCAAGDNLYFFTEGQSPQLWRFAVPRQLRPQSSGLKMKKHTVGSARPETARRSLLHTSAEVQTLLPSRRKNHKSQAHFSLRSAPFERPSEAQGQGLRVQRH
jgi:hypothetical protein